MKIAIIICGEFRWFDNFKTSFLNNFQPALQNHDVQFFAHFWNYDLNNLSYFSEICCPMILNVEDIRSLNRIKKFFGATKDINGSFPYQAYCAFKSFLLLQKYQKENKTEFDLYIKMRSDLVFLDPVILDNFDLNSIYVKNITHWRPVKNYVNDYIFFTKNYIALQKMIEVGFYTDSILENPESFLYEKDLSNNIYCPEEILANHLFNKIISVKTYDFNIDLARHHI
jgi:hypothetical protein